MINFSSSTVALVRKTEVSITPVAENGTMSVDVRISDGMSSIQRFVEQPHLLLGLCPGPKERQRCWLQPRILVLPPCKRIGSGGNGANNNKKNRYIIDGLRWREWKGLRRRDSGCHFHCVWRVKNFFVNRCNTDLSRMVTYGRSKVY